MTRCYDDIIFLPRPRSFRHSPMTRAGRAAQFAPFAALSGYDGAIAETARLTDQLAHFHLITNFNHRFGRRTDMHRHRYCYSLHIINTGNGRIFSVFSVWSVYAEKI